MSIYINLNCLFHAVRSNNADEVEFIIRHAPKNFTSNTYLSLALEHNNIAAATQLLKKWDPDVEPLLDSLIERVTDDDFAAQAVAQVSAEMPFAQWIVQAARLGRDNWVKALARCAEDEIWNASSYGFKPEIDFWVEAVREEPEVMAMLLQHMLVNIEALEPALTEAQNHYPEVVAVLHPYVATLQRRQLVVELVSLNDVEALKIFLPQMSNEEIREAYAESSGEAGKVSVWLAALPSLSLMEYSIPWMLSSALLHGETAAIETLLPHYRVVESSQREKRKHEPNPIAAALKNPEGLSHILQLFPVNHPHIASALNLAVETQNSLAVWDLLDHSPQMLDQALFSSLCTPQNIDMSIAILDRCEDEVLASCVQVMTTNNIVCADKKALDAIVQPRLERWRLNQYVGTIGSEPSQRNKI